ncbi:MAG: hypothetical protein IJ488_07020 [Clostridia bacterium]|nr:hypothetical protein [Clostridia bacterium]
MKPFEVRGEVDVHEVDYNGIAKTSSIMKYIQTAAQSQLTERGYSYDGLRSMSRAFILSKFRLEIAAPLHAYAPYKAISFPCESRGYSFLRCYGLECDGVTVARAVSVWALIDTESRALVKVDDFELGLPLLPPLDLSLGHIRLPSELTEVGNYGVHYGDVDQNMHMNNTKYPDMYSNFLPLKGKMISSITVNYQSEAEIGERLRVERAESSGRYFFRTTRSDGKVNSLAEIRLSDI